MAAVAEATALTDQYRRQQLALRAATTKDLRTVWPLFDGSDESFAAFAQAATSLILNRADTSTGLASAYYRQIRAAEGIVGEIIPRRAPRPPESLIKTALVSTGLAGTRRAIGAGQTPAQARATGLVQAAGAAARLVLSGGRRTVEDTVRADPQALGWARVTSGRACAFCAMLASRGPVYKSDTGAFQAHDHCACTNEPVFEGSTLPASSGQWAQLWQDSAAGRDDQLNRFRRALAESRRADTPRTPDLPRPTPAAEVPPAPVVAPAPAVPRPTPLEGEGALAAAPEGLNRARADLWSLDERSTLRQYKGTSYANLNGVLRRFAGKLDPDNFGQAVYHEWTTEIDRVMGRSALTADVQVSRAIKDGGAVFGDAWGESLVGAEWVEHAYVSTTAKPSVLGEFLQRGSAPATFRVRVPARTHAVELSDADYEAELLLERGLTMRVVADTGPGPARVIDLEVIPAEPPTRPRRT
ncbi:ADP-ribosyltransferase [Frankia sp. AgPm24]|uniref:ADP-ribosyltransferase n=1 Tax=Frankia sp. AgPm24 TaxID=631128 RepID=UPI00200F16F1|nr:ADP-ribosyltransferase [Frankia sp. AgPm24]MCK9921610.1 ADP-ribosyltransferase [Frankia sp. AgPm24]